MSKSNFKTVSIKLEGFVLKVIESKAKKECRSITQQVRKILQDYALDKQQPEAEPEEPVFK